MASMLGNPFFNWVHLWNTGAAFSLFANGGGWQRYFFIGIAVVVSIFLINLILEIVIKEKPSLTVLSSVAPWAT